MRKIYPTPPPFPPRLIEPNSYFYLLVLLWLVLFLFGPIRFFDHFLHVFCMSIKPVHPLVLILIQAPWRSSLAYRKSTKTPL